MEKPRKWNSGWTAATVGWLIASIFFPFLPEFMIVVFDGASLREQFSHPPMEYVATIGFWAAVFLLVWIPAGFRACKISREKGTRSAIGFVCVVFLVMMVVLGLIFRFLWNR